MNQIRPNTRKTNAPMVIDIAVGTALLLLITFLTLGVMVF